LNWILAAPQIFQETLNDLDAETKRLVLFQFKMEIEEYHRNHHLKEVVEVRELNKKLARGNKHFHYDHLDIVMYPGKGWQLMHLDNISDHSKVVIPGYCSQCNSESSFLYDINTYLKQIMSLVSPYPSPIIGGDCNKCGKASSASAHLMRFSHFVSAWS
jgi:hypothetical protein